MKIQQSGENYLETILMLGQRNGSVRSVDIANELGFSKPSVSIAMKNLRENGYIDVLGDGSIVLLPPGREIAEALYLRHTTLTDCFVMLGVSEQTACEDACKIEHILSEETFDAIRKHMDNMKR
ncbi:MAG: metal-dependent transcriptional regulator [Oscillospiraceae bacterium]|nr:metal-dependent transcriptional regulator [Oscillospiraceae bacterium]MDD6147146.1 metal-dependent transcriptional regulator [Oscillospiraceae bacterium]